MPDFCAVGSEFAEHPPTYLIKHVIIAGSRHAVWPTAADIGLRRSPYAPDLRKVVTGCTGEWWSVAATIGSTVGKDGTWPLKPVQMLGRAFQKGGHFQDREESWRRDMQVHLRSVRPGESVRDYGPEGSLFLEVVIVEVMFGRVPERPRSGTGSGTNATRIDWAGRGAQSVGSSSDCSKD